MPQLVRGSADVRSNSLSYQRFMVVSELCGQQRLDGWLHARHDRMQIPRLVFCGPLELFQRGEDGAALGMSEHDNQSCPIPLGGEFDAANLRRCDDVSSDADDEQIAQPLVEHELRWHPRVGAAQHDRKGLLARRNLVAADMIRRCVAAADAGHESPVSRVQAFECLSH